MQKANAIVFEIEGIYKKWKFFLEGV